VSGEVLPFYRWSAAHRLQALVFVRYNAVGLAKFIIRCDEN
jgi:hypothetical protein